MKSTHCKLLLGLLLLLLVLTSLVMAKKGRKRSRWNFGAADDEDEGESRGHRRGRQGGRGRSRNKLLLASIFPGEEEGEEESAEVVDLDAGPGVTRDLDEIPTSTVLPERDEEPAPATGRRGNRPDHNPCQGFACEEGEECKFGDDYQPYCQCRSQCYEAKAREKVCSSHNQTFPSRCALYREQCLCRTESAECGERKNAEVHVEYFAPCQEIPECPQGQLEDFPRRMREWLFNVMKDFAERKQLRSQYLELEKEAEAMEKSWVNAVLWKFCDLDVDPEDRFIDRHELITLKAPIIPMERCIVPFLDHCDVDSNHRITLKEWGHCLTLDEDEILDRCIESKP